MVFNKRDFLKHIGLSSVGSLSWPLVNNIPNHKNKRTDRVHSDVQPTDAQKVWSDLFIHFGIKTVYPERSSDGNVDPIEFNPTKFDTDHWCKVTKDAGMKYMVLVTKHHDGFCLWSSEYTDYSVINTPYNGNFIEKLLNLAKKHGLKVGFFYSLSDEHEETFGNDNWSYNSFMKNQLKELLTQYGDIVELWLDGFWEKQQHDWEKRPKTDIHHEKWIEWVYDFIDAWSMDCGYHWQIDHIYQFVKSLQLDCLVMNNSKIVYPGFYYNLRISTAENATWRSMKTSRRFGVGWVTKYKIYLPMQIETKMSIRGNKGYPFGKWFWHEWDNTAVNS